MVKNFVTAIILVGGRDKNINSTNLIIGRFGLLSSVTLSE